MLNTNNLTFESATARLNEIVKSLESGTSSLDEALKLYEEGVALVRFCNNALDNAESRIKILIADENGKITEKDFSENV